MNQHHVTQRAGSSRRSAVLAAAVLASGLLGACGSDDDARGGSSTTANVAADGADSTSTTTSTTAVAEPDTGSEPVSEEGCDIVSDEAVAAVLDAEIVRREPFADAAQQAVGCTKGPERTDVPHFVNVYLLGGGAPVVDEASAEAGSQPVDGLGDRAVYLPDAGTLVVADGDDAVSVQVIRAGVPGSQEDCVTIANDVMARRA